MRALELSLPVLWAEGGGDAVAGRLDVRDDALQLDGGPRNDRRTRTIPFAEIAGARTGRADGERLHGRQALVVSLRDGAVVSIAAFDRPGTLHELAERLARRARP
jgi:hypothetical protein